MDVTTYLVQLREMFIVLFPAVSAEEWLGSDWTDEQRSDLNRLMHALHKMFNVKLRPTYDRTVWDGHKSGKVNVALRPVRKATDKDGDEKSAPDAGAIFDEILSGLVVETPETVTVTLDEV